MSENASHIFRNWTWKKFVLNLLFFTFFIIPFGLGIEYLLNQLDGTEIEWKKTIVECSVQILIMSVLTTFWSPDKEPVFSQLIKKLNKK